MNWLIWACAGFLYAILVADVLLTRDGIRRGKGKIAEGNAYSVWFMSTDLRAVLSLLIEAGLVGFLFWMVERSGYWYIGAAGFIVIGYLRGKVVLKNYRINTDIL